MSSAEPVSPPAALPPAVIRAARQPAMQRTGFRIGTGLKLLILLAAGLPVYLFFTGVDTFVGAWQRFFESKPTPVFVYTDVDRMKADGKVERAAAWAAYEQKQAEKAAAEKLAAEKAAANQAAKPAAPAQPSP